MLIPLPAVSHYYFMKEMKEVRSMLNGMKISVNKVYNCVCPITETSSQNEDERGMPALPVDSFESMLLWESFLKDHDNSLHVVSIS
jgi:hypothetical protein